MMELGQNELETVVVALKRLRGKIRSVKNPTEAQKAKVEQLVYLLLAFDDPTQIVFVLPSGRWKVVRDP